MVVLIAKTVCNIRPWSQCLGNSAFYPPYDGKISISFWA